MALPNQAATPSIAPRRQAGENLSAPSQAVYRRARQAWEWVWPSYVLAVRGHSGFRLLSLVRRPAARRWCRISLMNRRTYLALTGAGMLAGCASEPAAKQEASPASRTPAKAIQLHVDLEVDPERENEMLTNYRETFRPTISKQPGFVEVKLLNLRQVMKGTAPGSSKYRLIISFETEEQRTAWVATDDHQKAWPTVEGTLIGEKYGAVLYDVVT
jgi:heme-degrading monooxygenase HmoA